MKSFLLLLCLTVVAGAADFTTASRFESVEAFVAETKALMPTPGKRVFALLFADVSRGGEIPSVMSVDTISEAEVLWNNKEQAMVFVKAEPVWEFGNLKVAALLLLERESGRWKIADYSRFLPLGKSADITIESIDAGSSERPLVQVEEIQGGGAYIKRHKATYTVNGSKIKRLLQ